MNTPEASSEQHRQEASKQLSPLGQKFFGMIEFDENEQMIMDVRKHWFGLFLREVTGFLMAIVVAAVPVVLALSIDTVGIGSQQTNEGIASLLIFVGLLMGLLVIAGTFIIAVLYKNNVIYITNEKLAQLRYLSLFNRKISQLSIGDVQDVSVQQKGIFAHWFNYGTLVVETAGEQQNYTFNYVPKPYDVSRAIVGAHEENLKLYGN